MYLHVCICMYVSLSFELGIILSHSDTLTS